MNSFFTIIKSDFLQRTRSYAFLITLCASLAIGYSFVPEPNASYSTLRIAGYVGYYNSAWFGYVTAIMTSIFLALIGFYLVNSGIKKDIDTKVGQVIAATPISNFKYLCAKVLSNFLLLLTIIAVIILMSMLLFVLYNDGYAFELFQFIKPHVFITIPCMFFISVIAVVFEVCFGRYSILQNIGFFFLFSTLMVYTPKTEIQLSLDVFGNKIAILQLESEVRNIIDSTDDINFNIGYTVVTEKAKKFEFTGMNFPIFFIISRLLWMIFGIGLIGIISLFFHRFDKKERKSTKSFSIEIKKENSTREVQLTKLPKPQVNYSIFPLFRTEFLMLFRKGKKWLWIINAIGMVLLVLLPLQISHQIVLPILWFLQVHRLSDITTKESTNNVHYFAFTSFKPISRLLISQIMAAIVLMLVLALPLIIRLAVILDFINVFAVIFGAFLIVMIAALSGILSKGKKLFEVLFFMLAYTNINGISQADYFGGFEHDPLYLMWLSLLIVIFGVSILLKRIHELEQ